MSESKMEINASELHGFMNDIATKLADHTQRVVDQNNNVFNKYNEIFNKLCMTMEGLRDCIIEQQSELDTLRDEVEELRSEVVELKQRVREALGIRDYQPPGH